MKVATCTFDRIVFLCVRDFGHFLIYNPCIQGIHTYVDQEINSTMTRVQHTRRVTCVQHTKSDSCVVSPLSCSTQISLMCSAQNIAGVRPVACHTRFKNTACSVHASVNLDMSCTVANQKIL